MAEGRMIKKEISDSRKLGRLLSDRPRVLYFMMLPHLDIEGRLKAEPTEIKGRIATYLPYTLKSIQSALEALHDVGLLILYHENGDQFLEYTRFRDFQKLYPDKEAGTKILPPTPENSRPTPEDSRPTPEDSRISKVKVSLSKDKDNKSSAEIVFDHWNSKKRKGWKSHVELSSEIVDAVRLRLKGYSVADIKAAIDNYALVLLDSRYKWSYAWTLYQFLTRHNPSQRQELQLYRWLPNNFHSDDYLKDSARHRQVAYKRREEPESNFETLSLEQKKEIRQRVAGVGQIKKLKKSSAQEQVQKLLECSRGKS